MAAEAKDVQENTEAESAGNGAAPGVEEGAGGADGAVALAKPSGHAAKEAGALAMLDSIVKEREMDTAMVQDAMKSLMQDHEAEKKAKLAREKALRSVVVNNADIAVSLKWMPSPPFLPPTPDPHTSSNFCNQ